MAFLPPSPLWKPSGCGSELSNEILVLVLLTQFKPDIIVVLFQLLVPVHVQHVDDALGVPLTCADDVALVLLSDVPQVCESLLQAVGDAGEALANLVGLILGGKLLLVAISWRLVEVLLDCAHAQACNRLNSMVEV